MTTLLGCMCTGVLASLTLVGVYQWVLALAALRPRGERADAREAQPTRFVVLIPAHNEAAGLDATLRSLAALEYPKDRVEVVVVADRCEDATADRARARAVACLERSAGRSGKGAAIAWAIDRLHAAGAGYDALVIIDADTIADSRLLAAFDRGLRSGFDIQQGHSSPSNPWETAFTRIIAVTSVLRNGFYAGKERLGLSAMLTGTGMCFSRDTIESHRWTAFSIGEDWEFSASLLLNGRRIHFNPEARVMARESRGFKQASPQRLRWASGRHAVAARSVLRLFVAGARRRRYDLWDAALPLVLPTYSAQAALALVCLGAAWVLSAEPAWQFLVTWAALVTGSLGAYFLFGVTRTEAPLKALGGVVLIPAFLPWRMAIELLGLLGYGRKRWVPTSRLAPTR